MALDDTHIHNMNANSGGGIHVDEDVVVVVGSSGGGEVVEEVAVTVPTTDDPCLPVMTFRMWLLGLTSCIVLMFVNTFFSYRSQPLAVAATFAQILVLPAGRFMAAVLPSAMFTLPLLGTKLSLNPGPFNVKEHVLITIFANAGVSFGGGDAYSVGVINIMKAFYKENVHFVAGLLIVLTTQVYMDCISLE